MIAVWRGLGVAALVAGMLTGCGREAGDRGKEPPPAGASGSSPAAAEPALPESVAVVPPGFERAAAGPAYIFRLRADVYGVVDTIRNQILFISGAGEPRGVARFPADFTVRDLDLTTGVILLGESRGAAGPMAVEVPRELGLDRPVQLSARLAGAGPPLVSRKQEGLTVRTSGGEVFVAPPPGGRVLNARYLGSDDEGRAYVYWEEQGAHEGSAVARAGRFDGAGALQASTRIERNGLAAVASIPVSLASDGGLLLLQLMPNGVGLARLPLSSSRGAPPRPPRTVGTVPSEVLDYGDVEEVETPPSSARAQGRPARPLSQAEEAAILARSEAMLNATWTMRSANYANSAIPNRCARTERAYWKRPTRYDRGAVGKMMTGLPYKWGGFDDVDSFLRRIAEPRNALAGDVCTCREAQYNQCLVPQAAGIDCSGFVSRAWGLGSHTGTSSLAGVSTRLLALPALRPGDALNKAGNHVRLFVQFEPGPEVRLRVRESAVSCGGVCENVYTPAQLNGYVPIRRR